MIPIPFTNMAISLSGGGYRATTFHLGALSFLDSIDHQGHRLLENVKIISTISGGTLTGVMYSLKLAEGGDFKDCYYKLYDLLDEDLLVERAIDKLNNPGKWKNKHKTRDLINSFAEVYNEYFYDAATFAKLYDSDVTHLTDVIFGASEFTDGIQFRFQEENKGLFGNGYLNLPDDAAKEIRLADAAASSSCFPGGFEPMIMPNDYGNGPNSTVNTAWTAKDYPLTGIMDGGIVDNQGIEGVKLAEKRHDKETGDPFIGTYIISDVSGRTMAPFEVPEMKYSSFKNFFSLNTINAIAAIILLAVVGILIFASPPTWGIVLSSVVLTAIVAWFIVFYIIRSVFVKEISNNFGGSELPELLSDFKVLLKTPVYIILYLIKFRVTSVLKMVNSIFLRRIRTLQLGSLFSDQEWRYRVRTNDIYTLESKELPPEMESVVTAANSMPTTLWFTEKEKQNKMLDALIACGQLTLCYNLIEYSNGLEKAKYRGKKIWDQIPADKQAEILELDKRLEEYWERFKDDPYWLVKQYKENRNQGA